MALVQAGVLKLRLRGFPWEGRDSLLSTSLVGTKLITDPAFLVCWEALRWGEHPSQEKVLWEVCLSHSRRVLGLELQGLQEGEGDG